MENTCAHKKGKTGKRVQLKATTNFFFNLEYKKWRRKNCKNAMFQFK